MALQRFYNATDKLVNAFIMGAIRHGSCASCAVGNLCNGNGDWILYTEKMNYGRYFESATKAINETGYSPIEIHKVEQAFEDREYSFIDEPDEDKNECRYNRINDADAFKGLCNVFDYMVSIEDWSEEEKGANIFELLESLN